MEKWFESESKMKKQTGFRRFRFCLLAPLNQSGTSHLIFKYINVFSKAGKVVWTKV